MRTLHLLCWNIRDIINHLDRISYQGFDSIQINPMQPFKTNSVEFWWLSYQPIGFYIGNVYGTKEDLIMLCSEARKYGISIISDIVCNHTAGMDDGSIYPHQNVDPKLRDNHFFWKSFEPVTNWSDRYQVTHNSIGLPGLNVSNYDLQNIIINYLNELIDCGVNGFRFDAAKSIALPDEGCDFWCRVIYLLKKYGLYIYGEVLFDDKMTYEYSKYIKVLTTSDSSDRDSIVRFAESHDSYYHLEWTKRISSMEIGRRYKCLSYEYPNTVFFARPYDNEWESKEVRDANHNLAHKKVYRY